MTRSINSLLPINTGPLGNILHNPLAAPNRSVTSRALVADSIYARPLYFDMTTLVTFGTTINAGGASPVEHIRLGLYKSITAANLYPSNLIIDGGEFLVSDPG